MSKLNILFKPETIIGDGYDFTYPKYHFSSECDVTLQENGLLPKYFEYVLKGYDVFHHTNLGDTQVVTLTIDDLPITTIVLVSNCENGERMKTSIVNVYLLEEYANRFHSISNLMRTNYKK